MQHSYLFPPLYAPWLAARLPGTVLETQATCDSCAMVRPTGLTRDPGPFDASLKCCTYFPFVPNFSIGAMLQAGSANVLVRLRAAETQGLLLPLGLFPSSERQLLGEELGPEAFGQRPELLCPFFDSSRRGCSVWENRPGVCTTYFCKSDRGFTGLEFWQDVETYLNHFEWSLANAVYSQLGFTEDDLEACRAAMTSEEPGLERDLFLEAAWKDWSDRKLELFTRTLELARAMSASDIDALFDDEHRELETSLRARV